MHSKIIAIEKKDKIFDICFAVFVALFAFSPLFAILLDRFFNRYKSIGVFAGIGLIGMYVSITGIKFYSNSVLKMFFDEKVKQFFNNPYKELRDLMKNFKREIREEGILEKDFDEALYLRMKYFFENEVTEIIQQRKIEAAREEELHKKRWKNRLKKAERRCRNFLINIQEIWN